MFRSQPYLEKTEYVQIDLDTPLTNKSGHKFTVRDRDNFYDWYNAYFRVDFKFEALQMEQTLALTLRESAPINGSFSLMESLNLKSAGKTLYEGTDIHKVIFIKSLLDFLDDFSRSVAKNQVCHLDSDATTVTDGNAKNVGMRVRAVLSQEGATVQTFIPLNRYSFFEGLSDRLLPPMQLEFEVVLQEDRENDEKARTIVVR